jgi:radical SAM-linked protein
MKAQRLRFRYRLTEAAAELRPREIVDAWGNAAKAAGLDVSYSEGKRPAPQISLAAALPQGVTSDWELLDLYLTTTVELESALRRISKVLPLGIQPVAVSEVGVGAPSVSSLLRWAEYEVDVPAEGLDEAELRDRIECLLSQASIPAEYHREAKSRVYDLRRLILRLDLLGVTGDCSWRLAMTLRAEQERTGRADQVVVALGLPKPVRIHRTRLGLADVPPAIMAYRRGGERED